jgi:hypothetical protein
MVLVRYLEWMMSNCCADVRVVLANENSEVMYVVQGRLSRLWSRLEAFQLHLTSDVEQWDVVVFLVASPEVLAWRLSQLVLV